jgi:hypothetical protein
VLLRAPTVPVQQADHSVLRGSRWCAPEDQGVVVLDGDGQRNALALARLADLAHACSSGRGACRRMSSPGRKAAAHGADPWLARSWLLRLVSLLLPLLLLPLLDPP